MDWKDTLKEGREIILATCSKNCIPNAIVVFSLGFVDDKVLIGACQMKTSLENIKNNNKVSIVAKSEREYYKINGNAKIYSSGNYFNIATTRSTPPLPKQALVIDIKEVFDLDKVKKLF